MRSSLAKLLTFVLLVAAVLPSRGQDPHRRDSLITLETWKADIVRVPVLTGASQPIIIVPNRAPFCFDKVVYLKLAIGSRMVEQTMYLDTHGGLVGTLPPASGVPVREIMPDLTTFHFGIMGLKGNVYNYHTEKGKNNIPEHWVFTGNTQTYQYQAASPAATNLALNRKTETRAYCGGKLTGQAYRFDNGPNTWYIYGSRYPEKIHPVPGKYLGNFGVGYLVTQEGVYLVLEKTMGSTSCSIAFMDNVHTCFDPTAFKIQEDEFQTKGQADLQSEQAKIDRERSRISGDCIAEKTALLDFRQGQQQRHEEILRKSKQGNTYQDTAAQRAVLSLMDPLVTIREGILSTKVSICGAQVTLSKPGTESSHQSASVKIGCLNRQLSALQALESRMQALDRQYSTEPARANSEKSKLYLASMRTMEVCN